MLVYQRVSIPGDGHRTPPRGTRFLSLGPTTLSLAGPPFPPSEAPFLDLGRVPLQGRVELLGLSHLEPKPPTYSKYYHED